MNIWPGASRVKFVSGQGFSDTKAEIDFALTHTLPHSPDTIPIGGMRAQELVTGVAGILKVQNPAQGVIPGTFRNPGPKRIRFQLEPLGIPPRPDRATDVPRQIDTACVQTDSTAEHRADQGARSGRIPGLRDMPLDMMRCECV